LCLASVQHDHSELFLLLWYKSVVAHVKIPLLEE
jgi:hypothetical protein